MTNSTLPYLPLTFECQFSQPISLPAFKGSMLRGALGHALKATVCAVRVKVCDACLLRSSCLYARFFEYKPNPDPQRLQQAGMPHPYVLEYPTEAAEYGPEQPLRFQLLLFGSFTEFVPYWIYSVEQMGQAGLGRRDERGRRAEFQLQAVHAAGERIYAQGATTLPEQLPIQRLGWHEREGALSRLRVRLRTPLRTKDRGQFATSLDFPLLVRLVLRRLQALQETFEVRLEPDNVRELLGLAQAVRCETAQIQWQEQTRYSNRQQSTQQMGGLTGELVFAGELAPFWPLLQIAQVVHLGKETSFGLGQIAVEVLDSDPHQP